MMKGRKERRKEEGRKKEGRAKEGCEECKQREEERETF
jgi:hypothetical protein